MGNEMAAKDIVGMKLTHLNPESKEISPQVLEMAFANINKVQPGECIGFIFAAIVRNPASPSGQGIVKAIVGDSEVVEAMFTQLIDQYEESLKEADV